MSDVHLTCDIILNFVNEDVVADRDFFVASGSDSHLNPNKTKWAIAWFRCDRGILLGSFQ